jgi:DNA-binding MarR family transcriptional regulator
MFMTERATRDARVAEIDRIIREITWHGQKQAIHTLMRPEIDLTMPQMVTLLAIHDSGTCRMGALAEATQQSCGTLTGIVDRLIQDGLVERVRVAGDRRVVEVALTCEGETRVRQVIGARQSDMGRMLARFDDSQLAEFEAMLFLFLQGVRAVQGQDEPVHTIAS